MTVELALVLPFLVVTVVALVDVSQFIVADEVISRASIAGARHASDATTVNVADVTQVVQDRVQEAYPNLGPAEIEQSLEITLSDGANAPLTGNALGQLAPGSELAVDVSFTYDTVRWIRGFPGLDAKSLNTKTVVRRE